MDDNPWQRILNMYDLDPDGSGIRVIGGDLEFAPDSLLRRCGAQREEERMTEVSKNFRRKGRPVDARAIITEIRDIFARPVTILCEVRRIEE